MWTRALQKLPGGELFEQGVADARAGRVTVYSCLVSIGWPALKRAGMSIEDMNGVSFTRDPELTMYRLLKAEGGDAFGRYNALLRRWSSFERTLVRAKR